jgi:hypothetical protein
MRELQKRLINYAKLHPDDPLSEFFIKSYEESENVRKEERKKWKQIADALVEISYRTTRASVKSNQTKRLNNHDY